jgi:hypothetical protein
MGFLMVALLSACSSSSYGTKTTNTQKPSETLIAIPTPSSKPTGYAGITHSSDELFLALKQVDPTWTEEQEASQFFSASFSNPSCRIMVFETFQDAVDNDQGYYGENWTYSGSFGQLGLVLSGSIETCRLSFPEEVSFPIFVDESVSDSNVLLATETQILDCLTRHAKCLQVESKSLPGPNLTSSRGSLEELVILDENGFCLERVLAEAQKAYCVLTEEATADHPDLENSNDFMVIESIGVREVLSLAASTSTELGKYMIYGDGWIIFAPGSTEADKNIFIKMNELIKGNLVARY